MPSQTIHDFALETIDGKQRKLADFAGQVLLVVNVASKCGLTPHYQGLQALYEQTKDRGFAVLGFPCNQFGAQEPGSNADVQSFCSTTYGVSFPMFAKLEVNGANRSPLYAWLTGGKASPTAPATSLELHEVRGGQGRRREGALQPARRARRSRAPARDRGGARGAVRPTAKRSPDSFDWNSSSRRMPR